MIILTLTIEVPRELPSLSSFPSPFFSKLSHDSKSTALFPFFLYFLDLTNSLMSNLVPGSRSVNASVLRFSPEEEVAEEGILTPVYTYVDVTLQTVHMHQK